MLQRARAKGPPATAHLLSAWSDDKFRVADDSPGITASADNSQKTRSPKWRFTDCFVVVTQFRRRNRTQFPALGWMFRRCD